MIQRENNRQVTFVADDNYRFFLESLEEAAGRYQADIQAYVLITNHVHNGTGVESTTLVQRPTGQGIDSGELSNIIRLTLP